MTDSNSTNRLSSNRANLLLALAMSVLTLLGLEFAYRAYLWVRYERHVETGASLYVPAEELANDPLPTRLRPGAQITLKGRTFSVDQYGTRTTLRPAVPGMRPTILFVGGSSVFGPENDDAGAPPAQAQRALEAATGHPVQVLNGAIPGFTTAEARVRAAELSKIFNPDVVVLVEAYNDAKRVAASAIEPMDYPRWRAWSKDRWAVPPWWARSDLLDRLLHHPRADWGFFGAEDGTVEKLPKGFAAPYLREIAALESEARAAGAAFVYGAQPFFLNDAGEIPSPSIARVVGIHLWPLTPKTGTRAVLGLIDAELPQREGKASIDFRAEIQSDTAAFADHVHLTDAGATRWGELMVRELLKIPEVAARLSP